jgi:hypothetical protein
MSTRGCRSGERLPKRREAAYPVFIALTAILMLADLCPPT